MGRAGPDFQGDIRVLLAVPPGRPAGGFSGSSVGLVTSSVRRCSARWRCRPTRSRPPRQRVDGDRGGGGQHVRLAGDQVEGRAWPMHSRAHPSANPSRGTPGRCAQIR
ncbi:hypothetical protein ACFFX0_00145 [Citricoccus parietis]|uniref:Uncharacterized protein n=1 Tax=Citricoccus parietis TaxID=592307 RepID=A0ABV5FSN4_9MICC